ncbi:hyaluronate lyase-like isoform X2 [Leguminivora glycinivorella]|uniref:hyaluronate lyase-like isoform X2 n=1 Tax=Leguminivora glycinivorella TaxID=1035111 RepID=UPI00200ECA34|nr:hyaluronate lyase-like isoform X2 [Leguminivora glycinivorella]
MDSRIKMIFFLLILISGSIYYSYSYFEVFISRRENGLFFQQREYLRLQKVEATRPTITKLIYQKTLVSSQEKVKASNKFDELNKKYRDLLVSDDFDSKNGAVVRNATVLSTVKECLEFMISPERYDGEGFYGNWWHWQIGAPTYLLDILIIIKNKISLEKLNQYSNIISAYVQDPYNKMQSTDENDTYYIVTMSRNEASSSQRVELARAVLGLGILIENETKISHAVESIVKVMLPVTKFDGFYKDGSYIEHDDIPYTGSYGNELVKKLGDILVITQGTEFEITSSQIKPFVECVERAFLPLIYRGETIAPVNGRAVSRQPSTTEIGSNVMYTLLTIATFGSVKDMKKIKESVKYWIRQNPDHYFSNARKYKDLLITIDLLNDSAIVGDTLPFLGAKMYASMDRFIQQTHNYTIGLSLYSSRISAFESGNNENKRGWHTSDGAFYLYNYDDVQFRNAYWPTVDPYRIPGTTVDTLDLNDELSSWQHFTSKENWVGGVASGIQALVGMALNKEGFENFDQSLCMDLKGKKSWFIVEGQIVALGAGISGSTPASIETIVDN